MLVAFLLIGSSNAFSETSKRGIKKQDLGVEGETDYADTLFYRYKANVILGVNIFRGDSALVSGAQFAMAPVRLSPFFVGPEITFSLFSPGSLVSALASGWYEIRVYGSPRLSLAIGALLGAGIARSIDGLSNTSLMGFIDSAIIQDINEIASVRGQFRPGFIGSRFAFMINFNVSFRFL